MLEEPLDLRNDTVSRPTVEMRSAMVAAEVGDEVLGDADVDRAIEVLKIVSKSVPS